MHSHSIKTWRHKHDFLGADHARNERRTWIVIALTAAMMVGEIVAGALFGSMALLADGFHRATWRSSSRSYPTDPRLPSITSASFRDCRSSRM